MIRTKYLEAAGTKWNFLPFKPGLVGGHCIGVDPYYLTHKAESLGYHSEVILSGRRINDNMGIHVANSVIKLMAQNELPINKADILILGITFKENCPDIRNSRVIDVITGIAKFWYATLIFMIRKLIAKKLSTNIIYTYTTSEKKISCDRPCGRASSFKKLDWDSIKFDKTVVYDVKGILEKSQSYSTIINIMNTEKILVQEAQVI